MDNKSLSEEDKSLARFSQEAQLLLVAGTVTTATALASAVVYLLLDEKRLIILMEELEKAMPDIARPAKEAELEALPYLASFPSFTSSKHQTDIFQSAVIEETLRLVSGVSYRLARSAPTETLQLGKWTIPPNVRFKKKSHF
jgi:cytochrome P450